MALGDILGSLGRATSEELPGIMQRTRQRSQLEKNRVFGGDFHTALLSGDEDAMQRLIGEASAKGVSIEGIGAASKSLSDFKKDAYDSNMQRIQLQYNTADDIGKARLSPEIYKLTNPNYTEGDLADVIDNANTRVKHLTEVQGQALEKGKLDIDMLRRKYEAGPKVETQLVKNEETGNHVLINSATGEEIKTIDLSGDNMPAFKGELGGKKLTKAQFRAYKGLGAEAGKKVAQVATANQMIDRLEDLLENDVVKEHLGRWGGTKTDIEAMLTGSAYLPDKVIDYHSLLYDMVDLSLRERSGAAVKQEEVVLEMETIIGGTRTSPRAIARRLNQRRLTNISRIKNWTGGQIDLADMEDVGTGEEGATTSQSGVGTVLAPSSPPSGKPGGTARDRLAQINAALGQVQ